MTARLRPPARCARLFADRRGAVMIEFAVLLPVLLLVALLAGDFAWYVAVRQQVASVARLTADNASRIGEDVPGDIKTVSEAAIIDVLEASVEQGGGLDMAQRGRIILSSFESKEDGSQWIHWQRCIGNFAHASTQGVEGESRAGIGLTSLQAPPRLTIGSEVQPADAALMFVEVAYQHRPLFGFLWNHGMDRIVEMVAFRTRERRDLTTVHNDEGVTPPTCG